MKRTAGRSSRLPRNVLALGFVSLLTDFSTELIYPLVPVFLAALGAGPLFIGLSEGVAETTASLLKLPAGWLSDRWRKRKALVIAGYGLSSLTRPLMAMAAVPWQVLTFRFMDRFGKGLRGAPRDALIAEAATSELRGRAFGWHRAMDHIGAVLGPLAGFLLLGGMAASSDQKELPLETLRAVFWVATLPAVLAVLVLVTRVREMAPAVAPRGSALRGAFPPRFRALLGVTAVFGLSNSSDAFLLLRAHQAGVATALLPMLWALLSAVKSLSAFVGSSWSDRVGRRPAILLGWAIYGGVYAGFAWAERPVEIFLLFACYGLYFGATESTMKALVADLVPSQSRSSAYGALGFTEGLVALPASLVMGWIWDVFGAPAAFLTGSALAFLALLLLAGL
ncbi:MAG: MFS transporter, partial [Acidobacteria bacterium]|nr:MFS transporter [Acidobacteriota bacterium]